jgi:hypothetical protein
MTFPSVTLGPMAQRVLESGRAGGHHATTPGPVRPVEVKPEQIQATMTDGVLEVRIPRPAESKAEARKIPVK